MLLCLIKKKEKNGEGKKTQNLQGSKLSMLNFVSQLVLIILS